MLSMETRAARMLAALETDTDIKGHLQHENLQTKNSARKVQNITELSTTCESEQPTSEILKQDDQLGLIPLENADFLLLPEFSQANEILQEGELLLCENEIVYSTDEEEEYRRIVLRDPDFSPGIDSGAEFSEDEGSPSLRRVEEHNTSETINSNDELRRGQEDNVSNDKEVKVKLLKLKKNDGRRYWDKKDCCIYCEKLVTNFSRHLSRNHSNEVSVGEYLASSGQKKKILLKKIKQRGNFFYNSDVLRKNSGELIVARRPGVNSVPADNYLPCSVCLGFFKKDKLYLHVKRCRVQFQEKENTKKFVSHQSQGALLLDIQNLAEFKDLKDLIFPVMRVDTISKLVKSDNLICEYGSRLLKKNTESHLRQVISGKMRELGRLLLLLQEKSSSSQPLQEFISPKSYKLVVQCVKILAGYNHEKGTYKTPSLATKLGHSVRQCADIVECKAMIVSNSILKETAANFKSLCDKQWVYDISARALKTLSSNKYNKTELIPLAKDIQLLHKLISEREEKGRNHLNDDPSDVSWRNLARVTLAHVIVLNRRRSGEVQRMTLEDYKRLHQGIEDPETESSFNKVEQLLTKNLFRVEIRGKRGNKVPVLLTPLLKNNLDLLVSMRMACKVNMSNPHLFALPNTESSCLRGSDSIRMLAMDCGASSPKSLTSTKLRKHVATVSQLLNLQKNELEQVAQFMGHSLNVHFDFYRLPEREVQIAKLGKLFLALEQGKISQYYGKKLDEITVNIDEKDLGSDSEESDSDIASEVQSTSASSSQSKLASDNILMVTDGPNPNEIQIQTGLPNECTRKRKPRPTKGGDSDSDWTEDDEEKMTSRRKFKLRRVTKKRPWSESEINAVMNHLHKNVLMEKVPSKRECENCKMKEDVLKHRPWTQIKDFVYNQITKAKRKK